MNKMSMYLKNWPLYFQSRALAKAEHDYAGMKLRRKIYFKLAWADIFVNMATGGDPRETISSSIHKDRKSSWGAGVLINVIEAIDDDHGITSNQPRVGEGSADNREIPGLFRVVLILWWIILLAALGGLAWPLLAAIAI